VKGLFITFEGPDGAGKTTQLKKLAAILQEKGHDVVVTREPGGTFISEQIRTVLLSPDNRKMVDQAEVLLYAASRAQHVHELIMPALASNKIVLCDRFIDASIAYQAYGLGVDEEMVRLINRFASSGLTPHRTYMLDVPVEVSLARLSRRQSATSSAALDRIEQRALDYHRKVREGFKRIADQNRHRVIVIDANRPEEEITVDITCDCNRLLKQMFS
jgi:dTMP kinase